MSTPRDAPDPAGTNTGDSNASDTAGTDTAERRRTAGSGLPGGEIRVAMLASGAPQAQAALATLRGRYPTAAPDAADVLVALGGDGFMLETLHEQLGTGVPVYGMHRGSVGFLMNEYREDGLFERLRAATPTRLRPLRMRVERIDGSTVEELAINEVSLHRRTHQAAKIRVSVDGTVRLDELVADGVLVSTAAGSTAYNLSSHGPILPVGSPLLALTPVSAFRPRRWRGALLPARAEVDFEVREPDKRPVSATADSSEVTDVARVTVRQERGIDAIVLFDPDHNLEERILQEQFNF